MNAMRTAAQQRLASCHGCHQLVPLAIADRHTACPRCGSEVHLRSNESIARAWAYATAAVILYIPANVFPIMTVLRLGEGEAHTILGGVKALMAGGQWPLALLVFFASVAVPMLKLVGLSYLLFSVQLRSHWRPKDRTTLYRIVEAVGRWSMIDIFMVSILVALVKLGNVATIVPGVGATAFAAVVIITVIAAWSFDPRLIWDTSENGHA